jgi:hypothetical protein
MLPVDDLVQPDEPLEPTPDEMMAQCVAIEKEKRLWLRSIQAFVAGRWNEIDTSPRVQFAADMATVAAFEAVGRLMDRVGR